MQGIFGSFPNSRAGLIFYVPGATPQHPHDGLNVDGQNRVWFTEEFANEAGCGHPEQYSSIADTGFLAVSIIVAIAQSITIAQSISDGLADAWDNDCSGYVPARQPAALGEGERWTKLGRRRE